MVGTKIHKNNIITVYRFSMLINLSVSLILLLLGENIVNYIYIFALYYAFSQCLYWTSYEAMIYDLNQESNFKNFFSYDSVIANVSAIIFPVLFGIILANFSYTIVFIMLICIALISLILSFTIKDITIDCQRINLKESKKQLKNKELFKYACLQSILDGLTNGGVIQMLTTLIIFSKFENEAFMGFISGIIGIFTVIVALISKRKINQNNFFRVVFPITLGLFLITIPISFTNKLIIIVIYKLLIEICDVLTNIEGNVVTFEGFIYILDKRYKLDYWWYMELTLNVGRAIGLITIIIIAQLTNNNISVLTILFMYFTTFYMLRTVVIKKIRKIISKLNM